MAITQAHIDALDQAIADGVRSVTIDGQTTIYNTTQSLIQARDNLQMKLNTETLRAEGRSAAGKRVYLYYGGRGY